jgi:hypothetical protein
VFRNVTRSEDDSRELDLGIGHLPRTYARRLRVPYFLGQSTHHAAAVSVPWRVTIALAVLECNANVSCIVRPQGAQRRCGAR